MRWLRASHGGARAVLKHLTWIVLLPAGWAGAPLAAGTASGTMAITATVLPGCTVDAGAMAFGTLTGESARGAASAQASLTLNCTPGTAYSVALDDGLNGDRRMADPTGQVYLDYEIYQDPGATRRWGSGGEAAAAGIAPASGAVVLNAYGRITATRLVPSSYSDVVTVVVTF